MVVGFYLDSQNLCHWFIYFNGKFESVDEPQGIGTTVINGVNNKGVIVGFYADGQGNTEGFVGFPE